MKIPGEFVAPAGFDLAGSDDTYLEPTSSRFPIPATVILSTGVNLFTVPDDEYWEIQALSALNTDASVSDTLVLHIVEDGGSATASNSIFRTAISGYETISLTAAHGVVLSPGAFLRAFSTNDDINVFGGVIRFFRGQRRD
jgi:hypothetical protein